MTAAIKKALAMIGIRNSGRTLPVASSPMTAPPAVPPPAVAAPAERTGVRSYLADSFDRLKSFLAGLVPSNQRADSDAGAGESFNANLKRHRKPRTDAERMERLAEQEAELVRLTTEHDRLTEEIEAHQHNRALFLAWAGESAAGMFPSFTREEYRAAAETIAPQLRDKSTFETWAAADIMGTPIPAFSLPEYTNLAQSLRAAVSMSIARMGLPTQNLGPVTITPRTRSVDSEQEERAARSAHVAAHIQQQIRDADEGEVINIY